MTHIFKTAVLLIPIFFGMMACSATQQTASTQKPVTEQASSFPSWYQNVAFQTDSVSFTGYGEAVSADSLRAIQYAEMQAKTELETGISELMESIRKSIADQNNGRVREKNFLITLRNANQAVQEKADLSTCAAIHKNGHYRGYAKVQLSKKEAASILRSGFSDNQNYWDLLSSSTMFREHFSR